MKRKTRKPTVKTVGGLKVQTNAIWHGDYEDPPEKVFAKMDRVVSRLIGLRDKLEEEWGDSIVLAYRIGIARGRALATASGAKGKRAKA